MNNWNVTEHQLRSWKPRGPSAKLKARLFPGSGEAAGAVLPGVAGPRWAWLAPVMGCFLAMMVVSNSRSNHVSGLSGALATDWLSAVTSNQSYAAYVASEFHSGQNALQNAPIEWAGEPRLPSGFIPAVFQATNTPHRN